MKKQLNKKGAIACLIVCLFALISQIPTTLSTFMSQDEITNPFALGTIDIEIEEEFNPPTSWAGETIEKKVEIRNVGSAEALIRVALVPRWYNPDGTPFAGDTKLIQLSGLAVTTPGWVDGGDGYYYYNAKVLSGEKTVPLLSEVTLNFTDLVPEIVARYQDKTVIVEVKAETVHALEAAYEAVWPQVARSNSAIDQMLRTLISKN